MLAELPTHPQVVANDLLIDTEHPAAGTMRAPRPVASFTDTPCAVRRLAPELAQHTDEVLSEVGVSASALVRLRGQGVIE